MRSSGKCRSRVLCRQTGQQGRPLQLNSRQILVRSLERRYPHVSESMTHKDANRSHYGIYQQGCSKKHM